MNVNELCPWCGSQISREKYVAIEAKIRAEEKKRFSSAEGALRLELRKKFNVDLIRERNAAQKAAQTEAERTVQAAKIERDAATTKAAQAEAARKQLEAGVATRINNELTAQRAILERDRDLSILKERSQYNREREALQKKMRMMEHQLEKKTANELGDGAEIDLFEALREAFQEDRASRVPKGINGADIIHQVRYKGKVCGSIIVDCKHRQAWQNVFVTKLRSDQLEAHADHAILSTGVFPRGHKEMCVDSGVIIISPARVVHMVEILRKAMITMHIRGLTESQKSTKMGRLYELITSESYARRFSETGTITDQILELDVDEKKAHDSVWKKRGLLAKKMSTILRELDSDVAAIVEQVETRDEQSRKPPTRSNLGTIPAEGASWNS